MQVWSRNITDSINDIQLILYDTSNWTPLILPENSAGSCWDKNGYRHGQDNTEGDDNVNIGLYFIKRYNFEKRVWQYWYIGQTGESFYSRNYMLIRTLKDKLTEGDNDGHPAGHFAVALQGGLDNPHDTEWGLIGWDQHSKGYVKLRGFQFCFAKQKNLNFDLVDRTIKKTTVYGPEEDRKTDKKLREELEGKLINIIKPIVNQRERIDNLYDPYKSAHRELFTSENQCLN